MQHFINLPVRQVKLENNFFYIRNKVFSNESIFQTSFTLIQSFSSDTYQKKNRQNRECWKRSNYKKSRAVISRKRMNERASFVDNL